MNWKENNPWMHHECSMNFESTFDSSHWRPGYQKKGYIDGKISVEWIKQFDKQTHHKAAGGRCLLLIDGHNSQYTYVCFHSACM